MHNTLWCLFDKEAATTKKYYHDIILSQSKKWKNTVIILDLKRTHTHTVTRTHTYTCMFTNCCVDFLKFQIKKLLNKPVVRESCYYRKLTDRGKDEPVPSFNESQIENLTGELTWIFVVLTVSITVMRAILTWQYVNVGSFIKNIQLSCDWQLL